MPEVVEVTDDLLRRWSLPAPEDGATKDSRGRVLVAGGAAQTPGAVLLAGIAALRAGAGKLAMATTRTTAAALAVAVPESMVEGLPETGAGAIAVGAAARIVDMAASVDALLLGPGMTEEAACRELVAAVLARCGDLAVVIDALALVALEHDDALVQGSGAVLTPNRKELALLLGAEEDQVDADRAAAVRDAARRFDAVVSVGGGDTLVASPDGTLWHDSSGNPGLGVSGSGDAAAGLVVGLLARGATPEQAAVWAAHLHGRAGDRLAAGQGPVGYLARQIAGEVPHLLAELAS